MKYLYTTGPKKDQIVKSGDQIPGGRVSKHYATIEKIAADGKITICYCGDVKSFTFLPDERDMERILGGTKRIN